MALKEKTLVTGASGFIGGWLGETLHSNNSTNVCAGIRRWSSAARLARFPIEVVLCDVLDREQIMKAMIGVNCVIHCATGTRETIIQGTRNMLNIARKFNVERFVHLSTAEVYGSQSGEIDESFPYQYTGNPYGDSKIEAEKLCWEYNKKGLPVTVIRPSIVYGPYSKDWTVRIAQSLQSGNWGIFKGIGEGVCNLIYISDLVDGILLAMHDENAVGEAFNIVGPELISWNQYFQKFNAVLDLPKLRLIESYRTRLRTRIMQPVRSSAKFVRNHFENSLKKISQKSRYLGNLMRAFEKKMKTSPRQQELILYNRNSIYLTSKAHDLLGFKPGVDIDSGLELSVKWLYHLGLVD